MIYTRVVLLRLGIAIIAGFAANSTAFAVGPNIVIVNIDDLGWGDIAAYGGEYAHTPCIDRLAREGTRFTQFYAGAPICSPSRASLMTGQYAARSNINSYLDHSASNLSRDNADCLSLCAPSLARTFRNAGYATGHFGKWHLGGGRDVGYQTHPTPGTNASAPKIVEYGYEVAWTQFEGLGDRIINVLDYQGTASGSSTRSTDFLNLLNQASNARGTGGGVDTLVYLERGFNATFMVDRTIEFIDMVTAADPGKPFFVNLWFDEVHTPHNPPANLKEKYDSAFPDLPAESRQYLAVLEMLDHQIGRLIEHIDRQGLDEDTLIIVTADNGAAEINVKSIGSSGPFRGSKGDLFEGGVREPLIVRWIGNVAANRTDSQTVLWMPDLFPTLAAVASVAVDPQYKFDGEVLADALLGRRTQTRSTPLFWNMNRAEEWRHTNPQRDGAGAGGKEVLALRSGNWKLLVNADGTSPELYCLESDSGEASNVAADHPQVVQRLAAEALSIRYSTPARTLPDVAVPIVRLKAEDLVTLGDGASIDKWPDATPEDPFNGTVWQSDAAQQPKLCANQLNGHSTVRFDGNDLLHSQRYETLKSSNRGLTVFAVVAVDGSENQVQRLAQIGKTNGAAGKVIGLDILTTTTARTNGRAGFRFNNGASLYKTPLMKPGFHIVVWRFAQGESYADATVYVDGTLPSHAFNGATTKAEGGVDLNAKELELLLGAGRRMDESLQADDHFAGDLAEFLVFDQTLSLGQINLVANYLSSQYDLPFNYQTSPDAIDSFARRHVADATLHALPQEGAPANLNRPKPSSN